MSVPARACTFEPCGQPAVPRLLRLFLWLVLALGASHCASLPSQVERRPSQAIEAPEHTPLGQLALARREQAQARSDSGFALLSGVDAAFTSRLALVDGAQRSLDLQYYAIHADSTTSLLLARIQAAAQRGVRVRILLDDFNSSGEDAQVLRLAFEPGIEIRLFNPLPGPRGSMVERVLGSLNDIPRLQKRMHNKLFIADSAWGIAGGRNLGDAYFGGDGNNRFVDLDVLAAGRIVREMSASFDRYWNDPRAYPAQSLLSKSDLDRLRERVIVTTTPGVAAEARNPHPMDLRVEPLVWAPARLLADHPDKLAPEDASQDAQDTVVDGLLSLMAQAREDILIVSPYFVPGPQMMASFARLRERGVTVRVLTNSLASTDAPAAHAGYARYRPQLLDLGVELHELRAEPAEPRHGGSGALLRGAAGGSKGGASRASLHAKAVIIDRRLAVIGSMNLDLRSQRQNSEVALVLGSAVLSRQAAGLVERSLRADAYRVVRDARGLLWRAPPGAGFGDQRQEPDAPWRLRWLVDLLGPLAPDEIL